MSMGSKAKASSSLWTRVVCSVWSAIAGRGSAGPESGLSGPATPQNDNKIHETDHEYQALSALFSLGF